STSPDLDPARPQTKKYLDAYQAKYKKAPEYPAYMASSYDQVYMIAQAFAEVGTDTSAVRDWLYGVKNWPGALGDITIDSNGDPLIGYHIKQVTNGALKDLGAYQP
ncbi:MAG: ABC transporter substrate-binding protein, partial [Patescibacteria group bacterium]